MSFRTRREPTVAEFGWFDGRTLVNPTPKTVNAALRSWASEAYPRMVDQVDDSEFFIVTRGVAVLITYAEGLVHVAAGIGVDIPFTLLRRRRMVRLEHLLGAANDLAHVFRHQVQAPGDRRPRWYVLSRAVLPLEGTTDATLVRAIDAVLQLASDVRSSRLLAEYGARASNTSPPGDASEEGK